MTNLRGENVPGSEFGQTPALYLEIEMYTAPTKTTQKGIRDEKFHTLLLYVYGLVRHFFIRLLHQCRQDGVQAFGS